MQIVSIFKCGFWSPIWNYTKIMCRQILPKSHGKMMISAENAYKVVWSVKCKHFKAI